MTARGARARPRPWRALGWAMAFAAAPALAQPGPGGDGAAVPPEEPAGYRLDAYRAPTPATLAGARVLSTPQAEALWRAHAAVFIDVLPRPPRPANLPAGTLWRDAPHASIPGSLWLPNTGFGALAPETENYLKAGLAAATGGDQMRPLVLFCQRQCWMSWNAAKRVMSYGYGNVSWYPEGTDGWSAAGLPLETTEPR